MTVGRRLSIVWLAIVVGLGGLLLVAGHARGPLDDFDPARQRPGLLDAVGRPTPAPQVAPGWPVAGRPGVIFFVRSRFLAPLCQAIAASPSLGTSAELVLVSSQAPATCPAVLTLTDSDGRLAAGFGMRRPRDDGPPVGYAVVDRTGRVRYRTLDPSVVSGLREVETIVKALP